MSDLDLAAIEARAAAATAGPWVIEYGRDYGRTRYQIGSLLRDHYGDNAIASEDQATMEFIAHARTDVPALVAAVRDRDAKLAEIRAHAKFRADADIEGAWDAGGACVGREILAILDSAADGTEQA